MKLNGLAQQTSAALSQGSNLDILSQTVIMSALECGRGTCTLYTVTVQINTVDSTVYSISTVCLQKSYGMLWYSLLWSLYVRIILLRS